MRRLLSFWSAFPAPKPHHIHTSHTTPHSFKPFIQATHSSMHCRQHHHMRVCSSAAAAAARHHPTPPTQRRREFCTTAASSNARPDHSSSAAAAAQRPLEVSGSIAAARAAEAARPDALFSDPFAAALCGGSQQQQQHHQQQQLEAAMDAVATRYIDESLANAMQATAVNSIQEGDFKQVVLFGDGFDTRPFRLDWPAGTLLFVVAPAEVHEKAEALLAASPRKPHAPRGCLLRRVNMNLRAAATAAADAAEASPAGSSSSSSEEGGPEQQEQRQQQAVPTAFAEQLSRAGFRGDRLSVWALQGLHGQGLSQGVLQQLLAEIANCAAFHSLVVGELPGPLTRADADNLLAEAGLLGATHDYAAADGGQYQRWPAGVDAGEDAALQQRPRWLVTAQQRTLSLAQMGIYDEWSTEYAEADWGDDALSNVS